LRFARSSANNARLSPESSWSRSAATTNSAGIDAIGGDGVLDDDFDGDAADPALVVGPTANANPELSSATHVLGFDQADGFCTTAVIL
jgi:hypothetical protein